MSKVVKTGFSHLKPCVNDDTSSPNKQKSNTLSRNDKRKLTLAKKVIYAKSLTLSEKEDIYRYLTGQEPPLISVKGRPSTTGRDVRIAMDFLYLRENEKDINKLIDTLREYDKKHIQNKDNPNYAKLTNNAIYSAVNRGVKEILKQNFIQWAIDYEAGFLSDISESEESKRKVAEDTRELYRLIEKYLEEKKNRGKPKQKARSKDGT